MFIKNKYSYIEDQTKLWRYMSFSKFLNMIETSSLYFCRIDSFEDKMEATITKGSHYFAKSTQNPWQVFELLCTDKQLEIYRNMTFANCWHINEAENPDMWENYVMSQGNEGIAIQTDFDSLLKSFDTNRTLTNLKMKYIDYETAHIDYFFPNIAEFLLIKDISFQYENELRIITLEEEYPIYDADLMDMNEKIEIYSHRGESIHIKLDTLIHKIYLSPNSTQRFGDTIKKLVTQYGLDIPITKSSAI